MKPSPSSFGSHVLAPTGPPPMRTVSARHCTLQLQGAAVDALFGKHLSHPSVCRYPGSNVLSHGGTQLGNGLQAAVITRRATARTQTVPGSCFTPQLAPSRLRLQQHGCPAFAASAPLAACMLVKHCLSSVMSRQLPDSKVIGGRLAPQDASQQNSMVGSWEMVSTHPASSMCTAAGHGNSLATQSFLPDLIVPTSSWPAAQVTSQLHSGPLLPASTPIHKLQPLRLKVPS
mmetsp:Transcript_102733/g.244902  ORF Transcript_102733/g.244902 Transcript_102733/m.244902 type:complete len:231 (-) Transcript_102733:929-1621(-)